MNKYETVFILKNDITEEQIREKISKIEELIIKNGKITKTENLGLKKLAYEVKKYTQGNYYIIEFESEPELIKELEQIYRITEEILKFIVVRKDD